MKAGLGVCFKGFLGRGLIFELAEQKNSKQVFKNNEKS